MMWLPQSLCMHDPINTLFGCKQVSHTVCGEHLHANLSYATPRSARAWQTSCHSHDTCHRWLASLNMCRRAPHIDTARTGTPSARVGTLAQRAERVRPGNDRYIRVAAGRGDPAPRARESFGNKMQHELIRPIPVPTLV